MLLPGRPHLLTLPLVFQRSPVLRETAGLQNPALCLFRLWSDRGPRGFIFDEQIFDADYFRIRMREHRIRAQRRREEEVLKLLAENRSGEWLLNEQPDLEAIPGLVEALDGFIEPEQAEAVFLDESGETVMTSTPIGAICWPAWAGHRVLFSELDPPGRGCQAGPGSGGS